MLPKTVEDIKSENDFLKKKYRQVYGTDPFLWIENIRSCLWPHSAYYRADYYYDARKEQADGNLADLKLILEMMRELPIYDYGNFSVQLLNKHSHMRPKRVRRIMQNSG